MRDSFSSKRPTRLRIRNELGQSVTLAAGPGQFETVLSQDTPATLLFLGLGPEPDQAAALLSGKPRIYYIEAPEFASQMPASWREQIPKVFQRLDLTELPELLRSGPLEIRAFRQAIRLFPSFWAPVLARCRLAMAPDIPAARTLQRRGILLVGQKKGLLLKELATAFGTAGFTVRICEESPGHERAQLEHELRTMLPSLLLSINFSGLDAYGETAALAQAAGTRVAVWCVDNPWHLLTKLKAPYWKQLPLFVTDHFFCQGLRTAGAAFVEHLPLAAWPQGMQQQASPTDPESELLFVGRSAFPGRTGFFAGLEPPAALFEMALQLLAQGRRPDFSWWIRQLGITSFWPGMKIRLAGLCAEECSWRLRLHSLQQAASCATLTVCGDSAWQQYLQENAAVRFLPPVDYYGPLMELYASARYTLNVTSLLLPYGLTQRHFDVWAAGGFLLTDATPGLDIFPDQLTTPLTFQSAADPNDVCHKLQRLEKERDLRKDLAAGWRTLISQEHTYDIRVLTVLEKVHLK